MSVPEEERHKKNQKSFLMKNWKIKYKEILNFANDPEKQAIRPFIIEKIYKNIYLRYKFTMRNFTEEMEEKIDFVRAGPLNTKRKGPSDLSKNSLGG